MCCTAGLLQQLQQPFGDVYDAANKISVIKKCRKNRRKRSNQEQHEQLVRQRKCRESVEQKLAQDQSMKAQSRIFRRVQSEEAKQSAADREKRLMDAAPEGITIDAATGLGAPPKRCRAGMVHDPNAMETQMETDHGASGSSGSASAAAIDATRLPRPALAAP